MGVFAQISDVQNRDIEDLLTATGVSVQHGGWVDIRITDVENELVGLVPSLNGVTDPGQLGDTARAGRVTALVCDKVLDLCANPRRFKQVGQVMADINATSSMSNSFNASIDFTDEELNRIRQRTQRPRFGTAAVPPAFGRATNTREARAWPWY